jgi:hypothetical protein
VAISNHRLLSLDDDRVTFRWKDYAHHNKSCTMTLTLEEFLRRFLQHVLPKGLPRIRYFGWLAISRYREGVRGILAHALSAGLGRLGFEWLSEDGRLGSRTDLTGRMKKLGAEARRR